ncbi:MAG: hypothetical protein FWC16_01255 [Defluviitaleaceae bacterium]|nr:hypothetical protein [Defluviitaleaceae bacterium]MCL2273531.1 hypothetical protein [Defluviitaleaceae bacterium]
MISNVINVPAQFRGNGINPRENANRSDAKRPTISNGQEVSAIITSMTAQANRTTATLNSGLAIDMGQLQYAEKPVEIAFSMGSFFLFDEHLEDMPYHLMVSLKSHAGHDVLHHASGERRSLNEMVSFIEDKLTGINNNADMSDAQRATTLAVWEGGFALAFRNHLTDSFFSGTVAGNLASGQGFINNVISNIEAGGFSEDVQNLMFMGLSELIRFEGSTHLAPSVRNISTAGLQNARATFQQQFNDLKSQITNRINN